MIRHQAHRGIMLLVASVFFSLGTQAQYFEYTPNCTAAYQAFMSMKINQGKKLLATELLQNKDNILPVVLINYEDFISLTFNENPELYKQRKPLLDKRLAALRYADASSPYYLLSKALLYYQWSIIEIKYGEYWNAAWNFRRSHVLLKENAKKFPAFKPNQVFLGSQEAIISTIPQGYKWVSNILGLKGNMKKGMNSLEQYAISKEIPFKEEAQLYYIYLRNYLENDAAGAIKAIKTLNLDTKNNYLFVFMAANLALNNKNAAYAQRIIEQRTQSSDYMPFPLLDYELADAKMKQLDYSALEGYKKYITTSKSNFYLKDACMNISFIYYLQGKQDLANQYKRKIKTIGKKDSDADKQAEKFASATSFPNQDLLKAKLLNDGGKHEQALQILVAKNPTTLPTADQQLEYYYRLARIYDDLEQYDKAIQYYNTTIDKGANSTEYFPARAALQAGYIFEKQKNTTQALLYFNKVLQMQNHSFKNSLDQRAKAGINRLK